jgi:SAM-dependent methyltransferase
VRVRVSLARGLLRLGAFIQSLSVMVMRPDDLVEFSRQTYARPNDVEAWSEDELVDSGLTDEEQDLLADVPKKGTLLLLGVGGGREAIPLARMGFQVTGVDYVAAMVDRARENAARRGITIEGLVQEISQLDVPADAYDVVWLTGAGMYSCVPTRARRVEMVRRIGRALKPGGLFLCQFHWRGNAVPRRKGELLRRLVAVGTLGNLDYEPGDTLWLNVEFVHEFSSEDAIRSELEEGGLSVERVWTDQTARGHAVCRKRP